MEGGGHSKGRKKKDDNEQTRVFIEKENWDREGGCPSMYTGAGNENPKTLSRDRRGNGVSCVRKVEQDRQKRERKGIPFLFCLSSF